MARLIVPTSYEEARSFKPLDPGVYRAEITDVHAKTAKSSGNAYLAWTFTVIDGPAKGRRLWHNTPFEGNAIGFLRDLADAVGMNWEADWEIDPDTDEAGFFASWEGHKLALVVDVRTGLNGQLQNSCKPVKI